MIKTKNRRGKNHDKKNNYVIVRTYSAGVFAGNLEQRKGKEVTLTNARRIHYWDGAASLSQLAAEGVTKPQNCRFAVPINITVTEAIEIIQCTPQAIKNIAAVKEWRA